MKDNQSTLNEKFSMTLLGFINQSIIDQMSPFFSNIIIELSTLTDISALDGISFAINDEEYLKRLKQFRRDLTPSNDEGVGVAMTISSIDGDFSKNHIVVNCGYFELENLLREFESRTNDQIREKVTKKFAHMLFHEMCHVSINSMMYKRFNSYVTKQQFPDKLTAMEHGISRICWDEFAVCSEANQIGEDQETNYEEILFKTMDSFEDGKRAIFKNYMNRVRLNDQNVYIDLFNDTYMLVHSLLKYASYYLGDIHTKEMTKISARIKNHELYLHIKQLKKIYKNILKKLEKESASEESFLDVGKLASKIVKENGLIVEVTSDRGLFINLDHPTQANIVYGIW